MADKQDILDRAYTILRDQGICRYSFASDGQGNAVPTSDRSAVKFCGMGATARAWYEMGGSNEAYFEAMQTVSETLHNVLGEELGYPIWHDEVASDEDVLHLFRTMASPTVA